MREKEVGKRETVHVFSREIPVDGEWKYRRREEIDSIKERAKITALYNTTWMAIMAVRWQIRCSNSMISNKFPYTPYEASVI